MELDDPDSSVSLDRANYPQNTDVVITIDDQALNVDPTGEDDMVPLSLVEIQCLRSRLPALALLTDAVTAGPLPFLTIGTDRHALLSSCNHSHITEAKTNLMDNEELEPLTRLSNHPLRSN